VQIAEAVADLGAPEEHYALVEAPVLAQVLKEFTPIHVFHHEDDMVLGLEEEVELDQAGVVCKVHYVLLGLGALQVLALDDHVLLQALHGLQLVVLALLDQQHLPE